MARNDAYIPVLQFGAGEVRAPQFGEVTISAFSYTHAYIVAAIIAYYEMANTDYITIRRPLDDAVVENETFVLCCSYTVNGETFRYVLSKPIWFDGVLYPTYAGQKLGPACRIEVWSLDDLSPAVASDDIVINVGPLTFQTAGQITLCGQVVANTETLTAVVI